MSQCEIREWNITLLFSHLSSVQFRPSQAGHGECSSPPRHDQNKKWKLFPGGGRREGGCKCQCGHGKMLWQISKYPSCRALEGRLSYWEVFLGPFCDWKALLIYHSIAWFFTDEIPLSFSVGDSPYISYKGCILYCIQVVYKAENSSQWVKLKF